MFRHEAILYEGPDGFVAGTLPFIREGLEADEPMLWWSARRRSTRCAKGSAATPAASASPTWRSRPQPRADHPRLARLPRPPPAPAPVRGIGEPIWASRSAAELVECQRHESLLNVAFAETAGFALLCPYDVVNPDEARRPRGLRNPSAPV